MRSLLKIILILFATPVFIATLMLIPLYILSLSLATSLIWLVDIADKYMEFINHLNYKYVKRNKRW